MTSAISLFAKVYLIALEKDYLSLFQLILPFYAVSPYYTVFSMLTRCSIDGANCPQCAMREFPLSLSIYKSHGRNLHKYR